MPDSHPTPRRTPPARLSRRDLAQTALGHALMVTNRWETANLVALASVRRSLHSSVGVLAHARHLAIEQASDIPAFDLNELASNEIREFAQQLAMTRPALERAIVDLSGRQGLKGKRLGKTLGVSASDADARAMQTNRAWDTELDPAILAWLGPGSCESLSAILLENRLWPKPPSTPAASIDSTGPIPIVDVNNELVVSTPSIQSYLRTVPEILDHVATCEACEARLQSLNGVADILNHVPLPEPGRDLLKALQPYKHRVGSPLPPSIEPRRFDFRRLRTPFLTVLFVVVVTVGGFFAHHLQRDGDMPSQKDRVERLIGDANVGFSASSTVLSPRTPTLQLSNHEDKPLMWHAVASADWLLVTPSNGRLEPGTSVSVRVSQTRIPAAEEATLEFRSDSTASIAVSYFVK